MFERFTDRARQVIVLTEAAAKDLGHNYCGTEHILIGLLDEGEGVAAVALTSFGVSLATVRAQVMEIIGRGLIDKVNIDPHPQFTPRAKKVLELALREALQLGHNYIGTEHILLGLIREDASVAAQILVDEVGDLKTVRERVITLLSGTPMAVRAKQDDPAWSQDTKLLREILAELKAIRKALDRE